MSLYTVEIGNRTYRVDLSPHRKTVNGEPIDTEMLLLNPNGLYLLRHHSRALELFLNSLDEGTFQMLLRGGQRIISHVATRNTRRARAGEAAQNIKSLVAPMHGLVVDVLVQEGQNVEKNQTLVVLESMKMQMQLRSPRAGKIQRVLVSPGRQVEKGSELVQFSN
ncbi:MAG: acetyl-CoA carboxylase biotin carboxyl carrier protein subunit [Anaerolineales bacterium]|nr:acetyl-CoA carboxylase biotin carboxyl carrier protein subunit [Anaerolineales bacterium]MCX7609057.1 acetyl-CoA carboxylase biotin carboxyl carrier protein subunit [Anaerolineales bacterium]MDW8226941.1 acetyl-CoA carboxylase biotin carboxyl carrier protein subunit [Anaerolineales bacterium]